MNTQQFYKAVLVWFVGLPITIGISFSLRELFGISGLGMPEPVWFAIHIILFLISLLFTYQSVKLTSLLKKILITSIFVTIGGLYYIILTWFYVIESGIDTV